MNVINLKVDFVNGKVKQKGIKLITGDYNSTKIVFEFDQEYSERKIFELSKPGNDEAFFVEEILNNEVVLVGKDTEGNSVSLFDTVGDYYFEVVLYGEDSKLTSVSSKLTIKKEKVRIGDSQVELYIPLFDRLMQEITSATEAAAEATSSANEAANAASTAAEEANNLDADLVDEEDKWDITITKKDGTQKTASIPKINGRSYTSLERLGAYIYKVSFDKIPTEIVSDTSIGGCTSYVKDGKLYRNLDWNYDEMNSFLVQCKGFKGMAFLSALTDDNMLDELIGQLPYHLADGVNDSGIMVSMHVLYNDWDWHGAGNKTIPLYKIPYLILSSLKSLDNIQEDLTDILSNVATVPTLEASEYLLQFVVTDGTTTYALLPPMNSEGSYVIQDITDNPKLTNFRWVEDETVVRSNLQDRPTGVERWNLIPTSLENLRFTKAYEENTRLSEFIGINHTTKDSTDEELEAIYNTAHSMYLERERDGSLWQTCYSIVYSSKGIEELYVQEKYNVNYINKGINKQPDWNQNDDTASDYIKNRTHWKDYTNVDIELNIEDFSGSIGNSVTSNSEIPYHWYSSDEYTVKPIENIFNYISQLYNNEENFILYLNDIEYSLSIKKVTDGDYPWFELGDGWDKFDYEEDGFGINVYVSPDDSFEFDFYDRLNPETISFNINGVFYHKIDSKYLPDETDPTIPEYIKNIQQEDINNWNNKQEALVSGTNIKTIGGQSILGGGDLPIENDDNYIYLGSVKDYNTDQKALNMNILKTGKRYAIFYDKKTKLFLKATYKSNTIEGDLNQQSSMIYSSVIYIELDTEISDNLESGSVIGKIKYYTKNNGDLRFNSMDIKIYEESISVATGSFLSIFTILEPGTNQTITGKKTFNILPETSIEPTTDDQLTNKKYVDDSITEVLGDIESLLGGI